MRSCIFFFAALLTIVSGQSHCQDGWTHYNTSCYSYFNMKVDFTNAVIFCETFGGSRLAEIETELENTQLKNYMKMQNTVGVNAAWIGGNDKLIEDMWMWDKTEIPIAYFDWGNGQPDDDGRRAQDCLSMWKNFDWKWADHYCDDQLGFLCEAQAQ